MEKMIQALFANETDAFQGLKAIQDLAAVQDISLGEYYVLSKDELGNTSIRTAKDETEGYNAIGGGIIGGLIGLLAGPLGFLVGIGAGMVAGAAGDTVRAEGISDYLDKVSENIPAGGAVVVAHVWEDWETPVDTALSPYSAEIFRMQIDADTFVPAHTDLEELNEEIRAAETGYLGAEEEEKAAWNEKVLLLKIKRESLLGKFSGKDEHQERQYASWVEDHHTRHADSGVEKVLHEKEKHDRIAARIAEQQRRLDELRRDR